MTTPSDTPVGWPLTPARGELLATLASLIRSGGSRHFVEARVIAADTRDFPIAWKPTLDAVHGLLHRVAWHAYFDIDVAVRDIRPAKAPDHRMLKSSELELLSVAPGVATFDVAQLGNDDVAGLAAHAIGDAYIALAPKDPFRGADREITSAEASTAAVYLGLGVLVANASMYVRRASRIEGRSVVSEDAVARSGGLAIGDATLLLAVQDVVRDDHAAALSTLLPPQQEWLERWRAVLEPHEDELRELLGLADEPSGPPLARSGAPRTPAAAPERDLRAFNSGRKTFRVPERHLTRAVLGVLAGTAGFAVSLIVGPVLMVVLGIAGYVFARRDFQCSDPACRRAMATELETCPGCGGTIVETIAHAGLRLDRLEALEGPGDDDPDASWRRASGET